MNKGLKSVGKIRRSQVATMFGPGAIIDFTDEGVPVSGLSAGLEEWDRNSKSPGLDHSQCVHERRLEKLLGVDGFRLPPVSPDTPASRRGYGSVDQLVAVRFPSWLQCSACGEIRDSGSWGSAPGSNIRRHHNCRKGGGRKAAGAVPVRFIVACANGHVAEFPWRSWAQHKPDCTQKGKANLRLFGDGTSSGLSGLKLKCLDCGHQVSMDGCFDPNALVGKGLKVCEGRVPWLSGVPENDCKEIPRVVQRGASNLYFPVMRSALDIPPWSDRIQRVVGGNWKLFKPEMSDERLMQVISVLEIESRLDMSVDQILTEIKRHMGLLKEVDADGIRTDEYRQFCFPERRPVTDNSEFEVNEEVVAPELGGIIDKVVRGTRLREVRAIESFTRIKPPGGDRTRYCKISRGKLNWLPAIEVRGEGVFFSVDPGRLQEWETQPTVIARTQKIIEAFNLDWLDRTGDKKTPLRHISARFIMIHSLAHAVIRALSLTCGYSGASLRERIYADDRNGMAGALIYTATPDSDGTLGGLARQAQTSRFLQVLRRAIDDSSWCSSDPLCIEATTSFSEKMNGAACHSCMLLSETSCEEYNRLLDRALLVGTPNDKSVGFFSDFWETSR